jgi:hypothetical protein
MRHWLRETVYMTDINKTLWSNILFHTITAFSRTNTHTHTQTFAVKSRLASQESDQVLPEYEGPLATRPQSSLAVESRGNDIW